MQHNTCYKIINGGIKMEIIREYGEISATDRYKMTARSMKKSGFKELIDQKLDIRCAAKLQETIDKEDGTTTTKNIMAIITHDNVVIAGNSKTTSDSFDDLYSAFGDMLFAPEECIVRVDAAQSKAGRTFITLQLV